jgi:hypothetical protein
MELMSATDFRQVVERELADSASDEDRAFLHMHEGLVQWKGLLAVFKQEADTQLAEIRADILHRQQVSLRNGEYDYNAKRNFFAYKDRKTQESIAVKKRLAIINARLAYVKSMLRTISSQRKARKVLLWFADQMEADLALHDDEPGWRDRRNLRMLAGRLRGQVSAVSEAVERSTSADIAKSAAALANIAMMIADVALIDSPSRPAVDPRGREFITDPKQNRSFSED